MIVRPANLDDAEAIAAIYNRAVVETTDTFDMVPRTLEDQRAWLLDHRGAHTAVVAESDGEVVGFGSLSLFRPRAAYATTVEDSVYVHHQRRGLGLGKAILSDLVSLATAQGFHTVMAHIVGHNEASIGLHRACGFELVGTEREVGRKFGRWLDVVVMQRML